MVEASEVERDRRDSTERISTQRFNPFGLPPPDPENIATKMIDWTGFPNVVRSARGATFSGGGRQTAIGTFTECAVTRKEDDKIIQVSMDDCLTNMTTTSCVTFGTTPRAGSAPDMRANTLGAEVELAVGATFVRVINNRTLTDSQDLIYCFAYGNPLRKSDPLIGSTVNSLAVISASSTPLSYIKGPHSARVGDT
ncbi:unnamed protein product [Discosporangium mesarthrocarpum]